MKRTLTLIFTLFVSIAAMAQAEFYNFAVGIQGGMTTAFTGFNYKNGVYPEASKSLTINKSKAYGATVDYYFTPFINAGLEYNIVQLKDGPDKHKRQFVSDFSTIEIRGSVALGQLVDYKYNDLLYVMRGLNFGLGYGVLSGSNDVEDFKPELVVVENGETVNKNPFKSRQHKGDIGKKDFKNVSMFPITIGYNYIIYNQYDEQQILLGLNWKTVFTNSDDIDGFNDDPTIFANKAKDMYSVFGISVKYMFGTRSLFYK
ncbi:hypothetical protein [Pseudopedobacter beijingensis]|uniref:Outer membrane protein beta-barrel domain-containing protein n=1 Tax=Pseudopedobacter beijingensis TaxID=1207056 RepID=A0ABW4I9N9_9SPHI